MTGLKIPGSILFIIIVCAVSAAPAVAINWEGHEDWLEDSPPALELQRHFDNRVAPLPEVRDDPQCQKRENVGQVPVNPYEPVPMLCEEGR